MYIIEQYHNYKMMDEKGVVKQTYEIQCIIKKLEHS
jgi:hypothetical protein